MNGKSPEGAAPPLRVLICDDDPAVPAELEAVLREYFSMKRLPQPEYRPYLSAGDMLAGQCGGSSPDIAFLDVEMPGMSGIQAGAQLQERFPFLKIFILTSHADYLDDAMRFHVFRYLSKPIDKARLFRNMDDALYQLSVDTRPVLIETSGRSVTRYAHEIVMAEAQGRRVMVRALDGVYESTQGMKYWESLLEIGSFYRVHRSFIINMKYVRSFSPTLVELEAPDGSRCKAYMARRRYQEFRNAYMMYVEAAR